MNPKERLLAVVILAVNLAVGLALTRKADLRHIFWPEDGSGLTQDISPLADGLIQVVELEPGSPHGERGALEVHGVEELTRADLLLARP